MQKRLLTQCLLSMLQVEKVLAGADGWQFDTWRLREVTNGHPLSALGFFLIQRAGLIPRLKLKPAVLARWVRRRLRVDCRVAPVPYPLMF